MFCPVVNLRDSNVSGLRPTRRSHEIGKSFGIVLGALPWRDAVSSPGDESGGAIEETITAVEGELREVGARAAQANRGVAKANRDVGPEPDRVASRREQRMVAVTGDHRGPRGIGLHERQLRCPDGRGWLDCARSVGPVAAWRSRPDST